MGMVSLCVDVFNHVLRRYPSGTHAKLILIDRLGYLSARVRRVTALLVLKSLFNSTLKTPGSEWVQLCLGGAQLASFHQTVLRLGTFTWRIKGDRQAPPGYCRSLTLDTPLGVIVEALQRSASGIKSSGQALVFVALTSVFARNGVTALPLSVVSIAAIHYFRRPFPLHLNYKLNLP